MTPLHEHLLAIVRWHESWDRRLRSRELVLMAGGDYRAGEDAIYELIKKGELELAPDSTLTLRKFT